MDRLPPSDDTVDDSGRIVSETAEGHEHAAHPASPTIHPESVGAASRTRGDDTGEQFSGLPARPTRVLHIQEPLERHGVDDSFGVDQERQRAINSTDDHISLRVLETNRDSSSFRRKSTRSRPGLTVYLAPEERQTGDIMETTIRRCQLDHMIIVTGRPPDYL
jgi:hypothetical protein